VHLGDRRGGDRLAEFDEQRVDRRAERSFDRGDGSGASTGVMRSCSFSNSIATLGPTMSGRVARNWPSLT